MTMPAPINSSFSVDEVRQQFPILGRNVRSEKLVYLDNAATLQKPKAVLDCLQNYYSNYNSNVHRGVHYLGQEATKAYEGVREKLADFLGVKKTKEIIFTKGATESLNLIATSFAEEQLSANDRIAYTRLEHHANIVPWQALAKRSSAEIEIIELNSDYQIDRNSFESCLAKKPKLVCISAMSNVTGGMLDLKTLVPLAKDAGAVVVVDAAQAAGHGRIQVEEFGSPDFLVFSGHKIGGPTGSGVLWGREDLLESCEPYQFGGDMISEVFDKRSVYSELPWKFEAGTPHIAGVIGLGAAIDFFNQVGRDEISAYEAYLTKELMERAKKNRRLRILGSMNPESRAPILSFSFEGIHSQDLAAYLDTRGIAVRVGFHCAQPLHDHSGFKGSTRASFSFYNTVDEMDFFFEALGEAEEFFL